MTHNIAVLRYCTICLNFLALLVTWLNQCYLGLTIISLPWTMLAYIMILCIAWYIYIIGMPCYDPTLNKELYDGVKPAGPMTILQFVIAFSAYCVNITLIRRQISGEPV